MAMKKRFLTAAICTAFVFSLGMAQASTVTGDITIDGNADDWAGIKTSYPVDSVALGSPGVDSFKLAYSEDGTMLYICYTGTVTNQWSDWEMLRYNLLFTTGDTTTSLYIGNIQYMGNGYSLAYKNEATSVAGDYTVELAIPVSRFGGNDFTVALKGSDSTSEAVSSNDIDTIDGNPYEESEEDKEPAVYDGIVIDGKFDDWAAVSVTEAACPNSAHTNCIDGAAAVFDGDYLYLYISDGKGGIASGAGTHSNGMYSIVTDLGRNMVFQLNSDGTVSGIEGVTSAHYGGQWEIAIPKSALPQYEQTLSFGLYQSDAIISDIANLQEDEGNAGKFTTIVYDGLFADWDDYPHTLIEYATAGSNEILADGEQALYSDGTTLYGHVVSTMMAHTSSYGTEMTSAITIKFNQDYATAFYPRLVAIDEEGNINWNPDFSEMQAGGKYEYAIASSDAWGTSTNINNLNSHDTIYGKITIDVGGEGQADEAEYYLDLELIAEKFNMDAGDFKYIESQFGKIGHEWAAYAGTSTGPFVGLALCLGCAAVPMYIKKRQKKAFVHDKE
jgi:hypothetical protein